MSLRYPHLVSTEDFYKDFNKLVEEDKDKIVRIRTKHVEDREKIIEGLCAYFKSIKGYYSINGYLIYDVAYLAKELREYNIGKVNVIRPVGRVSDYFNKHLQARLKRISAVNYKIKIYTDELKELDGCAISYEEYKSVSTLYNDWSMRHCLDGGSAVFAKRMGSISVLNIYKNFESNGCKLKVDYKASNDYKKYLIDNNKIPFRKEDAQRAKDNGEEYHGVEWLIYHYENTYPYIHWYKGNKVNTRLYTFVPFRNNNTNLLMGEIIARVKTDYDWDKMFNLNLGFSKYLHVLKNIVPGYTNKFRSTLFNDVN